MYVKLCSLEFLSNYLKEVSMGDVLTVQAIIANPLDWNHFYEKIIAIQKGDRTDFTVVTHEGERLMGNGTVEEVSKWSAPGNYGFKIKVRVLRQKSLTDRRIRNNSKRKILDYSRQIESNSLDIDSEESLIARVSESAEMSQKMIKVQTGNVVY